MLEFQLRLTHCRTPMLRQIGLEKDRLWSRNHIMNSAFVEQGI